MIFSLMDCDLELFTFADICFRGFNHIKHCFLVNSAFLLPLCATMALVCIRMYSVRRRPQDSLANFGSKSLSLFEW